MTTKQFIKAKWYSQEKSISYKEIKAHPNKYILETCYGDFDNCITVLIKDINIHKKELLSPNAPIGKKYCFTIEIDWGDRGYNFVYANSENGIMIGGITGEIED